jgi:hypothetical protein
VKTGAFRKLPSKIPCEKYDFEIIMSTFFIEILVDYGNPIIYFFSDCCGCFVYIKAKIPVKQKILWSVCIIISIVFLTIYLFIQGFERGRAPKMPTEELSQSVR